MKKEQTKSRGNTCLYSKPWVGWLFILPVILGIVIFQGYPIASSLFFSAWKRMDVGNFMRESGFYNYVNMFQSEGFWNSWKVTLIFTVVNVPLTMALSFLLAVLLNQKIKGVGVYRVLIYLPVIIPVTVSGLIYRNMFDAQYGLINHLLTGIGLPRSEFFAGEASAMPTYIFLSTWGLGGGMILWLSALKNVPVSLYEAANIDGANAFVKLVKITIPMCSSMIFYNIIVNVIGCLQTFGSVVAITGGTTTKSLNFFVVKIFGDAFGSGRTFGLACAECWILFIVIALLTALIFKTSKWVFYGDEG